MDEKEYEKPQDDFAVEITDLDQSVTGRRPRWLGLTPRLRRLSLAATTALFVLVVGLLLVNTGKIPTLLGQVFGRSEGTPNLSAGSLPVYLRGNPTWGHFTLDGRVLARTPLIGHDRPLELARGRHTIIWQADPFKPKTCAFSITDKSMVQGSCFLDTTITTNVAPGVPAVTIAFFASLNDLSTDQRIFLTQRLQAQFASYESSVQLQPGELYAVSEQEAQADPSLCRPFESLALCYAQAHQPLIATLSLQMDNLTSSRDPCVITNQCDSYRQDCRALCEDPIVEYSPQNISGWSVNAVIRMLWSYRTPGGQVIASAQPNSAIRGTQMYELVSLRLNRDAQNRWQITLFPKNGQISGNPVCIQATNDTTSVLSASFDDNSNMYVRQALSQPAHMAPGCLTIAVQSEAQRGGTATPTPAEDALSPASFLLRFGVLLAVNASAHKLCPDLPVVDANERLSIASLFGANLKEGEKRVKRKEEKWHRQSTKQYTKQRFKQLV